MTLGLMTDPVTGNHLIAVTLSRANLTALLAGLLRGDPGTTLMHAHSPTVLLAVRSEPDDLHYAAPAAP